MAGKDLEYKAIDERLAYERGIAEDIAKKEGFFITSVQALCGFFSKKIQIYGMDKTNHLVKFICDYKGKILNKHKTLSKVMQSAFLTQFLDEYLLRRGPKNAAEQGK